MNKSNSEKAYQIGVEFFHEKLSGNPELQTHSEQIIKEEWHDLSDIHWETLIEKLEKITTENPTRLMSDVENGFKQAYRKEINTS